MERLLEAEEPKELLKSSKDGSKAFLVQMRTNNYGRFVRVSEYGSGGRRGVVVVSK